MHGITPVLILVVLSLSWSDAHRRQKRAWIIDSFSIVEEQPGPYPYALGRIHVDRTYRVEFNLQGSGVDQDPVGLLTMDPETGMVMVNGKIDYEQYKLLKLSFVAKNSSNNKIDTQLGVEIKVLDINDHAPRFQKEVYETTISESATQGTYVITVLARDDDEPGTVNSTFDYRITAVKPNTPNVEFFMNENGAISFKGCLDYEVAPEYIISVEAKDHGPVSLSGSTTVIVHVADGNNHLPVITGHSGTGLVKEGEIGISPIHIHVTDKDTQDSPGWRVRYMLQGEMSEFFRVDTNPETNDGILTLLKPLDFEGGAKRTIAVSVKNEEEYFSCTVEEKTTVGLWKVDTSLETQSMTNTYSRQEFTVTVEDVNDPPIFLIPEKDAVVTENEGIGQLVEQFTAVDPDTTFTSDFEYRIGHDPANWVRVDSQNGQIFLADTPDRESLHVVNNIYTVTILAVDNGDPPMTGTATLNINVQDQNDNSPVLNATSIGICATEGTTEAEISAHDSDGDPYGGPFTFKLLEDHKGWSLDPAYGMSVSLKKEGVVFVGQHTLMLKISDKQGQFSIQNISVTVCDCSLSTNCLLRRTSVHTTAGGAAGIILLALFLLLGILLMALYMSCGTEKPVFDVQHGPGDSLLPSNIEMPGIDCELPSKLDFRDQTLKQDKGAIQHFSNNQQILYKSSFDIYGATHRYQHTGEYSKNHQVKSLYGAGSLYHSVDALTHNDQLQYSQHQNGYYLSQNVNYQHQNEYYQHKNEYYQHQNGYYQHQNGYYKEMMTTQRRGMTLEAFITGDRAALKSLLETRLSSIQTPKEELCDYEPHEYAYEDESETLPDLDPIPILEPRFDPDQLLDLGPIFSTLASICEPLPENSSFED
ncbi:cadherin-like protein 26 [Sardina pilchardus]|uniref:cadherin-like protein 26 n=1 Tax=Sardina pilchardus TaxID=27697 RepID=UPI002E114E7A